MTEPLESKILSSAPYAQPEPTTPEQRAGALVDSLMARLSHEPALRDAIEFMSDDRKQALDIALCDIVLRALREEAGMAPTAEPKVMPTSFSDRSLEPEIDGEAFTVATGGLLLSQQVRK